MINRSYFIDAVLVSVGLAALCGLLLSSSPALAQCNNLTCGADPSYNCDANGGSCPSCVTIGFGATCASQGNVTKGTGNNVYGSIPSNGSNATYPNVPCTKVYLCVGGTLNGACGYFTGCANGLGQCAKCNSSFSYTSNAVSCSSGICKG
jgi:hypothetical protein